MSISVLAALTASLTMAPLPTQADTEAPTEVVHVRSGELSNDAGWASIEARIQRATNRVCRPHGLRGLDAQRARQACYSRAFADAMGQLDRQYAQANNRTVAIVITAR
ncbi:UrcA family protein [Maricaulis sp.]|uniref:UrcA family protein n=1 Tax=Maricaulis sp. TaxID=1486257 RepID=UPI002B26D3D5|nr:UrcA family protein [Maricaulis sp.]